MFVYEVLFRTFTDYEKKVEVHMSYSFRFFMPNLLTLDT